MNEKGGGANGVGGGGNNTSQQLYVCFSNGFANISSYSMKGESQSIVCKYPQTNLFPESTFPISWVDEHRFFAALAGAGIQIERLQALELA